MTKWLVHSMNDIGEQFMLLFIGTLCQYECRTWSQKWRQLSRRKYRISFPVYPKRPHHRAEIVGEPQ